MNFSAPYFGIYFVKRLIEFHMSRKRDGFPRQFPRGGYPSRAGFLRTRSWALQLLFSAAFLLAPFLVLTARAENARPAPSDDKKEAELRTVHGVVMDKDENGISSSIVYLENMKTQSVRTYITDDAGNYRFSGLDPNEDYEIHAEKGELVSSTRTISSFDSRRDMEITLKLIHKKK